MTMVSACYKILKALAEPHYRGFRCAMERLKQGQQGQCLNHAIDSVHRPSDCLSSINYLLTYLLTYLVHIMNGSNIVMFFNYV